MFKIMTKFLICLLLIRHVLCTIDINLAEFQYLAANLSPVQCRKLIAALHYNSHDLPPDISAAMRQVSEDTCCLQHLLHWNSSPGEGRGKTHDVVEHRLRQIHRQDLADWLGKTVFDKLAEDVDQSLDESLNLVAKQSNGYPITTEVMREETEDDDNDDPWQISEILATILLVCLLLCLVILIIDCSVNRIKKYKNRKTKVSTLNRNVEEEKELLSQEDDYDMIND